MAQIGPERAGWLQLFYEHFTDMVYVGASVEGHELRALDKM